MDSASQADFNIWPLQLGRLMADSEIGLHIDQDRVDAFIADELARLDPASIRIAEQEARFVWQVRDDAARADQRQSERDGLGRCLK